jgi:uncharacterized metal-binding protein
MASGKTHDRSIFWLLPVAVAVGVAVFPNREVWAIGGYAIGGWLLSPDIDLKQTRPSKRWGFLSPFWQPYRAISGHRGFSHIPIIGTASRLLYLSMPLAIVLMASQVNPMEMFFVLAKREELRQGAIAFFVGCEMSALIHLVFDYSPGLRRL